jgi:CRISPR-associated protein Csm4
MNTYCVALEVQSPLGTPLAADTLWGHIAWGLRWNDGEPALVEWLARYDAEPPPLVLSDPLPAGFWPRPALPPMPRGTIAPTKEEADLRKRLSAVRWLPARLWEEIAANLTSDALIQAVRQASEARSPADRPPAARTEAVVHAGINRLTGGTAQPEGGSLFAVDRTFFAFPACFHVWARSPEPLDTVRRWFEQALAGGYGRDAASGAGQIAVIDAQSAALPAPAHANAGIALGAFTPRPGDPLDGFFKAGVRCGRLGGDFAIGPLPDGATQRQKRPVSVFEAGTLLACPDTLPDVVGRVLSCVHQWPAIRHYAMTLLLPCRVEDQLLAHPVLTSHHTIPSVEVA